ncbi:MAG TPA: APC family permease, partial [Chlamydiales bacterium]|nr:APC family permease [Chlamydiales bacterium]
IAECGLASVPFLLMGILLFFLPVALVSAELATTFSGGIYEWVKRAFGHKYGFLAIWFLWIENVLYYPMMLAFIVSTITFIIDPALIDHKIYMFCSILAVFWGTTLVNLKGFKVSTIISSIGAICGTFIPSILIIAAGCFWFFLGKCQEISFSASELIPTFNASTLSLFAGVIFSLFGIEMSAIHSSHVENPQKSYAKSILISALFTIVFSIVGILSIAMVIPKSQIILSAGALQAFDFFGKAYGLAFLMPLISLIVAIGALGSMSTWIMGPCVGLIEAANDGDIPSFLKKGDVQGNPRNLLVTQAILVSIISFLFLFTTINDAYWIFLILSTQFYIIMYILLFAAAIKLRYKYPSIPRPFQIPGKLTGVWTIGVLGLIASVSSFILSFLPPANVPSEKLTEYLVTLLIFLGLFSGLPFAFSLFMKRSQKASF